MFSQKKDKAFTLIELIVGIAIIGIIALGIANMNFNTLTSKQELDIFTNKIKSQIELIRNNALSGKGIGIDINIPTDWKIDYSITNSGTIILYASNDNKLTWVQREKFLFKSGFYIPKIECSTLNGVIKTLDNTSTGSIIFTGINISYDFGTSTSCDETTDKILEITTKFKNETKVMTINSLNGLVEIK